ncbi:MAG: twin-arginine translocase subunit TatC, partial [Gammaproteobacteria bacterium]|nr:twin-arginine translocase subunit TatC [Gammaproteobacteria bacterium]
MTSAEQAQELTLIDHLVELRDRLLKCLAAVVICFIALFAFSA